MRPALLEIAATPGIGEVPSFATYVGNALSWADEFAPAERLVSSMITLWRSRRAPGSFAYPLIVRAELRWRTGRFVEARADAEEALLLADAAGALPDDVVRHVRARARRSEPGRGCTRP